MLFATPLRNGKVLLFYNRDENMLQFSKNKSKRANEDDYGLYSKDTLRLAESERLLEVKWIMGAEPDMRTNQSLVFDDMRSMTTIGGG